MAEVSRSLHRLAVDIGQVPRSGMIAAAKATKKLAQQEAARSGRSTVRIWRKRSKSYRIVKLRAVDDIRTRGDVTTCRVQGVPVGPWVWANTGAGPHLVGLRPRRNARKVQYLAAPGYDHPVRAPVYHPGQRGRGVWRRVAERAERLVPEVFADEVRKVVR